uniref:UDENN domain-containing protein n=1 Tax=Setaria digitata TaxID=48799 RepID=A0A915PXV1_9BILA
MCTASRVLFSLFFLVIKTTCSKEGDLPEVFAIISPIHAPLFYLALARECVCYLGDSLERLKNLLSVVYRRTFPTDGSSLHVLEKTKDGIKRNIVIRGQGPVLGQSDCSAVVRRMGPEVTVAVIGALLAEQRVIIAGGSVQCVSHAIQSIAFLLHPFSWPYTLIPVLPDSLLEIDDLVIVDLDGGIFVPQLTEIYAANENVDFKAKNAVALCEKLLVPKKLAANLTTKLREAVAVAESHKADLLLQKAMLSWFAVSIWPYKSCSFYTAFVAESNGDYELIRSSKAKLVASHTSKSARRFAEWFVETGIFREWIRRKVTSTPEMANTIPQIVEDVANQKFDEYILSVTSQVSQPQQTVSVSFIGSVGPLNFCALYKILENITCCKKEVKVSMCISRLRVRVPDCPGTKMLGMCRLRVGAMSSFLIPENARCAKNGDTHLDSSGLRDLCVKLNLSSFADVILERILSGCAIVDFTVFKERFVQLLPDIINVTTIAESLEISAEQSLSKLGIEAHGFLTRYEVRILCENTPELNSLGLVEIDELFDQADTNHVGRIKLSQFLAQFQIQKRLGEEVNFITETFVPSVNLFEALDPSNTGTIRCQELLEHWRTCGISIEQGLHVLKVSGQPIEGTVNALSLSGSLERQLGNLAAAPTASTIIRVALLSLHAFIDHIRCSLKEAELRAEHFYKQFQQANQRHVLLIEELEQNQLSIEEAYEQRFRNSDERYRVKISQIEERFSQEKKDLLVELEKAEEELARLRKNESSYRSRLQFFERQCARITDEAKELSETMQQLEQMNRHLRNELNKALQPRPMEETQPTMMLRHRVELLIAHNKRLREKIEELTSSGKKRSSRLKMVEPLYSHFTNAFRSEMLALRRRREGRPIDTLSEMESEPESIFIRARRRRMLKVKERKRRHDRIAGIMENSSSNEWVADARKDREKGQNVDLSRKLKQALLEGSQDSVVEQIKEQHRKEIVALKHSANKALADALTNKIFLVVLIMRNYSFEKERRQFQIKLEEFECELSRLKTVMSPSTSDDSQLFNRECGVLQYNRESNVLEDLTGIRTHDSVQSLSNVKSPKFCVLAKRKGGGNSYSMFVENNNDMLNIEKTSPPLKTFCKNVWMVHDKCSHYEMIKRKLKQIHATVIGDGNIIESGFEDVISSADSISEEHAHLKNEIKKLSSRLYSACEKIVELRAYFARCSSGCVESFESWRIGRSADDCLAAGSAWIRQRTSHDTNSISRIEQLKAENILLNARLAESTQLVKMLVQEYSDQLNRTSRLGRFIRSIYSIDEE